MGPEEAPTPDMAFYYAISIIFGTMLCIVIWWSVRSYVSSNKQVIDKLGDSFQSISTIVAVHEEKHKQHDTDIDRQITVMAEMLKTLNLMTTKLEVIEKREKK